VVVFRLEGNKPVFFKRNPQLKLTNQSDGLAVDNNDANIIETFPVINYPNPFNIETTIHYTLHTTEVVNLSIYNTLGQKVETLIQKRQHAGSYQVVWNAGIYPSGVYAYRLQAGNNCSTGTMTLVK
jgi:hypothetical protein